jgi:hypothetical protein
VPLGLSACRAKGAEQAPKCTHSASKNSAVTRWNIHVLRTSDDGERSWCPDADRTVNIGKWSLSAKSTFEIVSPMRIMAIAPASAARPQQSWTLKPCRWRTDAAAGRTENAVANRSMVTIGCHLTVLAHRMAIASAPPSGTARWSAMEGSTEVGSRRGDGAEPVILSNGAR